MFEVGFTEILLICALALIVLGPQKLPKLAAQLGRWVGRARAMARQFRDQLDREVDLAEINAQYNDGRDHRDLGAEAEPAPPGKAAPDEAPAAPTPAAVAPKPASPDEPSGQ